jgi:EKC/KEOPS complex subunit PCC1/LAGE3
MADIVNARTLEIPFASHKHAQIAKQSIEVDAELQPQAVKRTLEVRENMLIAYVTMKQCNIRLSNMNLHYNPQNFQYSYDSIGSTDGKWLP